MPTGKRIKKDGNPVEELKFLQNLKFKIQFADFNALLRCFAHQFSCLSAVNDDLVFHTTQNEKSTVMPAQWA